MVLHKSSRSGPRPPGRKGDSTSKIPAKHQVQLPAMITPDAFSTKNEMLEFIAAASEGIKASLPDGRTIFIQI